MNRILCHARVVITALEYRAVTAEDMQHVGRSLVLLGGNVGRYLVLLGGNVGRSLVLLGGNVGRSLVLLGAM